MSIAVIDYGAGNVRSVELALERLGEKAIITSDADEIRSADKVIFPGVGHAASAMDRINELGLGDVIKSLKQPVLGVCLGMQLLCESTEEGDVEGLGIFSNKVLRFKQAEKVPHMGWNKVELNDSSLCSDEDSFYFVHSYYVEVNENTTGTAGYGDTVSAMIEKDNFYGCQFHPEKSGDAGSRLLKQFLEL